MPRPPCASLRPQVLYFSPELRECLLTQHVPEPDVEFCLACELALLFRMMVVSHGTPCQVRRGAAAWAARAPAPRTLQG